MTLQDQNPNPTNAEFGNWPQAQQDFNNMDECESITEIIDKQGYEMLKTNATLRELTSHFHSSDIKTIRERLETKYGKIESEV